MLSEGGPSAADIVYLFGDRFVKKARMGGEKLVYGEAKVKLSDLVDKMVLAAFAGLASQGYLGLELVEQKKLGMFTSRDIGVTRSSVPPQPLYGVERAIWDNITDDPKEDGVREIISRVTGGKCPNPRGDILEVAMDGLAEQGYLTAEKEARRLRPDKVHWSAKEELIRTHEGRVDEVKAMLSSLEARDPALYKQLAESVKKGIAAMVESADFDSDFD